MFCIPLQASDLPKFNVVVDTWRKGKDGAKVSWTRAVTVSMNNHSITVDQGTVVSVSRPMGKAQR